MTAKPPPEKGVGPRASGLGDNPFAKLDALRDQLPSKPVVDTAPSAKPEVRAPKGPARAVVRFEKKGRGGKMVTLIEKLGLPPAELERWCSELKKDLGCGGSIDGDAIVLQGDLRSRLPALLTRRGVRDVVGNEVHK
jgi:translation initiation factor 1